MKHFYLHLHIFLVKNIIFLSNAHNWIIPKSNREILTRILRYREKLLNHFSKCQHREYLLKFHSANFTVATKTLSKFEIGDVVLIIKHKLWKCKVIKELFSLFRNSQFWLCLLRISSDIIKRLEQFFYKFQLDLEKWISMQLNYKYYSWFLHFISGAECWSPLFFCILTIQALAKEVLEPSL